MKWDSTSKKNKNKSVTFESQQFRELKVFLRFKEDYTVDHTTAILQKIKGKELT